MIRQPSRGQGIPSLIHVVNVGSLLLAGLILLLTVVVRAYQLVVLLPIVVAAMVYWYLRSNPRVAAGYFGLSMALLCWVIICENIVTIDNTLGSQISRSLRLDLRLQSYVDATLRNRERKYLVPCCDDPLTWHYQPGSFYRESFDCPTCYAPYEIQVDETGYLNRQADFRYCNQPIDLFLAGDSVLQGVGMPSVLEWLRTQIPLRMWNLSIQAYSPRQKVSSLIAFALPKQPRWLIIEFYAGNDLAEEIRNDVCESTGDFRCRYNEPEVRRRLAQHPVYSTLFDVDTESGDIFAIFADIATHNLTLATTRYLINAMKGLIRATGDVPSPSPNGEGEGYDITATVAGFPFRVRQGRQLAYLKTGMELAQYSYECLVTKLEGLEHRPTVILLYHPTPYEVYREKWVDPNPEADQSSASLRDALRRFTHAHGWAFLDLTRPLQQAVQARNLWLYGQFDKTHLSPQGTQVFAAVLAAEFLKIITP
jgi:hypothetical protein